MGIVRLLVAEACFSGRPLQLAIVMHLRLITESLSLTKPEFNVIL